MISGTKWNPNTVKLYKVCTDNDSNAFHPKQHTFGYHNMETGIYSYLDHGTEDTVLHSINPALVKMGAKLNRKISEIINLSTDDIPARRTFISHARHLNVSSDLFEDLWYIFLKRDQATLGATTQRGVRLAILPLSRRYRAVRLFSMKWQTLCFWALNN